ncbi:MAG TPA: helix-hairpin-helix domain-containing protein [Terriglobales bacterium]|jgi:competence ComEA-like helix-hairpin-helix protein|nr:helix-hairpin-helix domain-containing protein [Terriglobales bacterium]
MLPAAIQPNPMSDIINLNTASAKELTQLPGVAKNVAYNIVSHRKRHGYFTHWEELLEVKEFPAEALDRLKERATLLPIEGVRPEEFGPRRIKAEHLVREAKKPRGYTKAIRATRTPDRLKRSA